MAMDSDASDLPLALDGDQRAFARIYDRHAPVVLALCRRRYPEDATDALQETFVRAFDRLHELGAPDKLRPWLYAIACRVCNERIRSATRRRKHEEKAMHLAGASHPPPATPTDSTEHHDELDRLSQAINQLDDDERLAIHLHYLERDPVAAATHALGLSRSGYYKLLDRARTRLARLMREVKSA